MITAAQCRGARTALGLGVRGLSRLAMVAADTVIRLERGEELKPRTVDAIARALKAAGGEFTNGRQPAGRLRNATRGHRPT
jgi:hypothetical protein